MKRRTTIGICLVFVVLPFAVLLLGPVLRQERPTHRLARTEIQTALSDGWLDREVEPIVLPALEIIKRRFNTRPFSLNKPYEAGQINVYLIREKEYQGAAGRSTVIGRSRKNSISVAPDILVMDSGYLQFLAREAIADLGPRLEASRPNSLHTFTPADTRRSLMGSRMLRLRNIDAFEGDEPNVEQLPLVEDFRRLSGYRNEKEFLEGELADPGPLLYRVYYVLYYDYVKDTTNSKFKSHYGDSISSVLANVLTFVFLHELGHLEEATDGGFLGESLEKASSEMMTMLDKSILEKERAADRYAIRKLETLDGANPPDPADQFLYLGLYSTASILDDMVMAALFRNVRGLNAQKFGTFIDYESKTNCEESERGFFDFQQIRDIDSALLPLLSGQELKDLFLRMAQFQTSSHDSYIVRSDLISKALARDRTGRLDVREPLVDDYFRYRRQVLTGLLDRDEEKITAAARSFLQARNGRLVGRLLFSDLAKSLHGFDLTSESVTACPASKCITMRDAGKGMYLESINDEMGAVLYSRVTVAGLLPRNREEGQRFLSDDKVRDKFETRLKFARQWIAQVLEGVDISDETLSSVDNYIKRLAICGFGSFEIAGKGWTLRGSTLGNLREISMEFISTAS